MNIGGLFQPRFPNGGEIGMEKFAATQPMRNEVVKRAIEAGINYFDITHKRKLCCWVTP